MAAKSDQLKSKNNTMQWRKMVKIPTICGTPDNGGTSRAQALGKLRLLAVAIGASTVMAQHSLASTLDHMSYTTLPGNQQQISFTLSDPVNDPQSFKIDHPARIAIDLMGTTNALDKRVVPVGVGNLESVSIVEANDRTRLVLNLGAMTGYETKIDGDRLLVTLDSGADTSAEGLSGPGEDVITQSFDDSELQLPANADAIPEIEVLVADAALLADASMPAPTSIDELPIAETLPMPDALEVPEIAAATDVEFEDDGLVVELPSSLPLDFKSDEEDSRVLAIDDFAVETGAPIEEYIDDRPVAQTQPIPRMEDKQSFASSSSSSDRGVDYSRRATNAALNPPALKSQQVVYSGEELSLNFQDIEIRSVLQLLADFTDMNIVVSDTVGGKLTLRLKNVPWDQALDIILRTKGLDKRESGNVIMVAPATEIAATESAERAAAQELIALEPLRTEFVQVNYAKAGAVAAILKSETGGVLSERGNVTIDDRTNTLLVNDTADVLGKVRSLVTRLDVPVRQVLIESRIVIATDDFNREFGTRFGISRNTTNLDDDGIAISGTSSGALDLITGGDTPGEDRFNVNLPVINRSGSLGLAFATLPFGTLLELELSAMQAEGRGEVISTPRVITANQHEAYIEQGVEIPFAQESGNGGTTTSFRKAVLGLKVRPQITPDERIIIDLTVNKDTVGEVFDGIPSVDTREVNTQVLVANGETVVLGGIYEQSTITQREQVPFFGDLPLVGRLFQNNIGEDDKSELLVFVTPKIIKDSE